MRCSTFLGILRNPFVFIVAASLTSLTNFIVLMIIQDSTLERALSVCTFAAFAMFTFGVALICCESPPPPIHERDDLDDAASAALSIDLHDGRDVEEEDPTPLCERATQESAPVPFDVSLVVDDAGEPDAVDDVAEPVPDGSAPASPAAPAPSPPPPRRFLGRFWPAPWPTPPGAA